MNAESNFFYTRIDYNYGVCREEEYSICMNAKRIWPWNTGSGLFGKSFLLKIFYSTRIIRRNGTTWVPLDRLKGATSIGDKCQYCLCKYNQHQYGSTFAECCFYIWASCIGLSNVMRQMGRLHKMSFRLPHRGTISSWPVILQKDCKKDLAKISEYFKQSFMLLWATHGVVVLYCKVLKSVHPYSLPAIPIKSWPVTTLAVPSVWKTTILTRGFPNCWFVDTSYVIRVCLGMKSHWENAQPAVKQ